MSQLGNAQDPGANSIPIQQVPGMWHAHCYELSVLGETERTQTGKTSEVGTGAAPGLYLHC